LAVVFFLAFEYVVDGDEHLASYCGDGFLVSTPSGDA
jgi:NAD kinase